MKNLRRAILFAIAVMTLTTCFAISSNALTSGYYNYELRTDGTVEITKYTGGSRYTSLTIPAKINNKAVTRIGSSAFQENQYIKTLTVPKGVTSIGQKAFYKCASLTTLSLPNTLTSIGDYAFERCENIKSLTLPSSITDIGYSAFAYCKALNTISIPNTPINIGRYAFYVTGFYSNTSNWTNGKALYLGKHLIATKNLSETYTVKDGTITLGGGCLSYHQNLTTVYLPDSLKKIGLRALAESPKLSNVIIPDSVTYLGYRAFWNCPGLKEIIIPESVTVMGEGCFLDCTSLEKIEIPDSITYLNSSCFKGCISLKSVKLPSKIETLGATYFAGCTSLESVTLPDSCTKIATGAFEGCTALKTVTIPGAVTKIESKAFNKCSALKTVNFKGTKALWNDVVKETYNDPLNTATVHYFTSYKDDGYGSCLEGKQKTAKCTDCSATHSVVVPGTAKSSHGTIKKYSAKAATCTAAGYKTHYRCSNCDARFSDAYGKKEISSSSISISKLSHKLSKVSAKTPVCGNDGYKAHYKCSRCSKLFTDSAGKKETTMDKIKLAGGEHNNTTVTTKATLTKNGKIETKCKSCGTVSKTTVIYYPKTIKLSATSYTYNGKAKTPSVTVKDSAGNTLTKDKHYTVKYSSGRINPGKYTVAITFKGNRTGTKKLTFTINPGKVTGCKATSTTTSLKLAWSKVVGATEYNIYYKSGESWKLGVKGITGTSHTYTNRKPGQKYSFKIIALAKSGSAVYKGAFSDEFTTATKPAKITGLKATKHTNDSITLTWKAVSGAAGYRVYSYNTSTKKYTSLAYVAGKNTLTVKKLKLGSTYNLSVRAYINTTFGAVWGDYSSPFKYTITPAAPSLKAVSNETGKVNLTWNKVSGATGYKIYWLNNNKTYEELTGCNLGANSQSLKLKNLSSGKYYYFRLRAYTKSGSTVVYSNYSTVKVEIK